MAQSIPLENLNNDELRRLPGAAQAALTAEVKSPHAKWIKPLGQGPKPGLLRSAVEVLQPPIGRFAGGAKREFSGAAPQTAEAAQAVEAALALTHEVRRAQQGDSRAMTALIEGNRAWVRGIAYTVLGDAHLAEDAAQEVCVRVVKHLRGLDTPEAFRPWVYRMTRNVALSMAQRRERSPQPLSLDTEQFQEVTRVARHDIPGASLEADERVSAILETIGRLPEIYREVLVLKHVQDMSYTEMSTILGVSVKSLEVRLVRARKLLQERLGRRFDRGRRRDPREEKE